MASDLGLHCHMTMSHKKDAMFIYWLNVNILKMAFQQKPNSHATDQPMAPFGKDTKQYSQGPQGQKIGPVRIVCRFMVTYIKTFSGVLPLI